MEGYYEKKLTVYFLIVLLLSPLLFNPFSAYANEGSNYEQQLISINYSVDRITVRSDGFTITTISVTEKYSDGSNVYLYETLHNGIRGTRTNQTWAFVFTVRAQ